MPRLALGCVEERDTQEGTDHSVSPRCAVGLLLRSVPALRFWGCHTLSLTKRMGDSTGLNTLLLTCSSVCGDSWGRSGGCPCPEKCLQQAQAPWMRRRLRRQPSQHPSLPPNPLLAPTHKRAVATGHISRLSRAAAHLLEKGEGRGGGTHRVPTGRGTRDWRRGYSWRSRQPPTPPCSCPASPPGSITWLCTRYAAQQTLSPKP